LTCGHGLWWFDMFGHWYDSESLKKEMQLSLTLYSNKQTHNAPSLPREVAVFLDENAYSTVGEAHPAFSTVRDMRVPLGSAGTPYDVFLICDFSRIDWENSPYKAALFLVPGKSPEAEKAMEYLSSRAIPFLRISEEKTVYTSDELRTFYRKSGVFLYCDSNDVIYAGNGYAALHAATEGVKTIFFPKTVNCTDLISGQRYTTDCLSLYYEQFETKLFRIGE